MRPVLPEPRLRLRLRFPTGLQTLCGHCVSKMPRQPQARHWMVTSFKVDESFLPSGELLDKIKYAVWQLEQAPTTNALHFQGFVQMDRPLTRVFMSRLFPGAHLEERKGTPSEAREYCMKEDTRVEGPWEHGNFIGVQGQRSDLESACELVKAHGLKRVAEDMPAVFVRNHKGLAALELELKGERDWPMDIHIYWGDSGSGKSRKAREENPDAYYKDCSTEWWDGYHGQECVVIDDFYGGIKLNYMLKLFDRYPMIVQFKGGSSQFVSKKIVLTSNVPWEEWYERIFQEKRELKNAFQRRLNIVTHFQNSTGDSTTTALLGI